MLYMLCNCKNVRNSSKVIVSPPISLEQSWPVIAAGNIAKRITLTSGQWRGALAFSLLITIQQLNKYSSCCFFRCSDSHIILIMWVYSWRQITQWQPFPKFLTPPQHILVEIVNLIWRSMETSPSQYHYEVSVTETSQWDGFIQK